MKKEFLKIEVLESVEAPWGWPEILITIGASVGIGAALIALT
jgi:hypothetical protein